MAPQIKAEVAKEEKENARLAESGGKSLRVGAKGYMLYNAKSGKSAPAFLPNPKGNAKTLIMGLNFLQDKLTVFQDRDEEQGARVQFVDLK